MTGGVLFTSWMWFSSGGAHQSHPAVNHYKLNMFGTTLNNSTNHTSSYAVCVSNTRYKATIRFHVLLEVHFLNACCGKARAPQHLNSQRNDKSQHVSSLPTLSLLHRWVHDRARYFFRWLSLERFGTFGRKKERERKEDRSFNHYIHDEQNS